MTLPSTSRRGSRRAAWIDAIALEARRRRYSAKSGQVVIGHYDWRVEHLRFDGRGPVAVYDRDALVRTREPLLLAAAVRGFTADWTDGFELAVPTLDQVRGFLLEYERARDRTFGKGDRAVILAAWVEGIAYAARCEHAAEPSRRPSGGFQEQLAHFGPRLIGIEAPPGTPT